MSLLPSLDKWEFFDAKPADGQADLRILIDELLEDELQTLGVERALHLLLDTHLRVVVVEVVANTVQQLSEQVNRRGNS